MVLPRALFAAAALVGTAFAVKPADVNGISFIQTSNNQRLQMVGIDYQPGGEAGFDPKTGKDVLSDGDACLRDATIMQQLGVNTVRVYNVNPQTNHDLCMSIFNAAGIYVIVDVNSPFMSINRAEPWTSYYEGYLSYIFSQVENFKGYPNTLAFFAANEVINDVNTTGIDPPYIRAVTRDLRQYIAKHSSRHIPVGYSAADVREVLSDTFQYLSCAINGDANDTSRGEIFGLNSYSWCGAAATFTSAGYDQLVAMFQSSNVPVFFSEYGCNIPIGTPRVFNEVQALYGPNMTSLNGGLVYEYSQETSNYGLVQINSDGSVQLLKDYDNLQGQYNKMNKDLLTQVPNSNNAVVKCDPSIIKSSGFSTNWTLPAQPDNSPSLITNGVQNAVQGKLVDVTNLNVKQTVKGSNGNTISGLKLNVVDGANTPSGAVTSSGNKGNQTSTGSGKKGAASTLELNLRFIMGAVAGVAAFALL